MDLLPLPRASFLVLATVMFLPACGGKGQGTGKELPVNSVELEQIGEMYQTYVRDKKRSPTSLADLKPYAENFLFGFEGLRSGQFVLVWGVNPAATPRTILAYEKGVPSGGGLVLMSDGKIRKLTAAEFQAAPKGAP